MIRPFELHRPAALPEVGALLEAHGDAAALYAGGTELLLLMKEGLVRPRVLVDVKRVAEIDQVAAAPDSVLIGAAVTHRALERSAAVRERCPLVSAAARHVANVRVRAVGTVGGNLAFADPHSDLATLFLAFDARVHLWSLAGTRQIDLGDFVVGPYETARRDGEVLTAVRLSAWPAGAAGAYLKFGVHERPTLGVAAMLRLDPHGRVVEARAAVGCIGPRPVRLAGLEAGLAGADAAEVAAGRSPMAADAAASLDVMADLHGAADYKRAMAAVFLRRALAVAARRALGQPGDARHPHTVVV